jgi:hypothetical protein
MSFDPTPEAKALFATLDKRWAALLAWGIEAKMPGQRLAIGDWKAYRAAWLAERDKYTPPDLPDMEIGVLASLGAESNQLASVERSAEAQGYAPSGTIPGSIPGSGIDVTQTSESTQTAAEIDEAANAAEAAAKKAAEAPASLWTSIPWTVKLGAVVVGAAIVVGSVRR